MIEESTEQYVSRITGYVGSQAPLAILAKSAEEIRVLVNSVHPHLLNEKPSAREWSIAEIIAHLADSEIVAAFRFRKVISEPGCDIPAYNQDRWAQQLDYQTRDVQCSLRVFEILRETNVSLFSLLSDDQWQQFGLHAERGKETLSHMARLYAGHDLNHIQQIARLANNLATDAAGNSPTGREALADRGDSTSNR